MTVGGTKAEADVALLFPPVRDIRMVYNLTLPLAVLTGLTVWSVVANATVTAVLLASMTGVMALINWYFFLRAATGETMQPTQLPDYRAGWSVPLRFQPEIRWQAISLAIRAVGLFVLFFLTMAVLVTFLRSADPAHESLANIARVYFIGFLIGIPIALPHFALSLSRYGVDKSARRQRDRGLPVSLIRRREAAIEALRKKWPNAVPMEAHNPDRTVSEFVDVGPMHAVKAALASILVLMLNYAAFIVVFISSIWFADGQMEWEFSDALAAAIPLTLAFVWFVNWKSPFLENQIRRRLFKIPASKEPCAQKEFYRRNGKEIHD